VLLRSFLNGISDAYLKQFVIAIKLNDKHRFRGAVTMICIKNKILH